MAENNQLLQKKQVLGWVSLFRDCSSEILDEIASSLEELEFDKNQVVFNKGDHLHALYIIAKGRVKVHDGEYLFAEFGEKDFFGEYSLIDASIRSASVTTLERTQLFMLHKSKFDQLVDQNPPFARSIMEALIARLRKYNVIEEKLAQKSNELREEKARIEQRKQELENLNATKDKFFSVIAHDLKNPFNTIIGLAELMLYRFDSYSTEKLKEFVTQIYNYSTHTYTLLDNMLQWARSQTRQLEVQPEEIDVFELIQDNINLLQNKAEEKKIQLEKDIQEEAVKAFGDENMINTVIRNLISNAIKFTPEQGKVIIHTRPQDHHWLYLAVIDNGVGIARENISKLFDLNTGYTTHGTHSEKGTGLGLILCKEFVQMNGGEIGVESEENKGSTFWITIPRDKSTGEKHQKSHSQTYENL